MKLLTTLATLGVLMGSSVFAAKHNEAHFCDIITAHMGGKAEVKTDYNKRIDILTDTHAIECDWTSKPYEAIGQALAYGEFEGKLPGIVFFHPVSKKWHNKTYAMMKHLSQVYGITIWWYEVDKKTGDIWHKETYN